MWRFVVAVMRFLPSEKAVVMGSERFITWAIRLLSRGRKGSGSAEVHREKAVRRSRE